jgi:hypothetical protein
VVPRARQQRDVRGTRNIVEGMNQHDARRWVPQGVAVLKDTPDSALRIGRQLD